MPVDSKITLGEHSASMFADLPPRDDQPDLKYAIDTLKVCRAADRVSLNRMMDSLPTEYTMQDFALKRVQSLTAAITKLEKTHA